MAGRSVCGVLAMLLACALAADTRTRCRPREPCWPTQAEVEAFRASLDPDAERVLASPGDGEAAPFPLLVDGVLRPSQERDPVGGLGPDLDALYTADFVARGDNEVCFDKEGEDDDTCLAGMRNVPKETSAGFEPAFVVWPLNAAHVQASVRFASAHNLAVCVAGSGHDFLNRHSCRQGLLIRTTLIKDRDWSEGGQVTVGAGNNWGEVQRDAASRGKLVVAGHAATVGVVGWSVGGGHSFIAPSYGLGVDQLLAAEIVTADGELRQVDEESDPGLLWALRGGGGSAFGVVVSLTLRTHDAPPSGFAQRMTWYAGPAREAADVAALNHAIDGFMSWSLDRDNRWGGLTQWKPLFDHNKVVDLVFGQYGIPDCETLTAVFETGPDDMCSDEAVRASSACDANCQDDPAFIRNLCPRSCGLDWIVMVYMVYRGGSTDAEFVGAWDGLDGVFGEESFQETIPQHFDNYWEKAKAQAPEPINVAPVPSDSLWSSIAAAFVTRDVVESGDLGELMKSYFSRCFNEPQQCVEVQLYDTLTGNVGSLGYSGSADGEADDHSWKSTVSISEGFRCGLFHILAIPLGSFWQADHTYRDSLYSIGEFSYFAESEYAMAADEWRNRYWGEETYDALSAIKDRVDPDGLFWCRHCIGDSEHDTIPAWTDDDASQDAGVDDDVAGSTDSDADADGEAISAAQVRRTREGIGLMVGLVAGVLVALLTSKFGGIVAAV